MRIKELREANNMQQKALANILGISSNTLSQYENGKREPGIEIVSKIAKYFDVSTDYIYDLTEITTCRGCGLSYCPHVKLDRETHLEIHRKWIKAKEKYGFCYANMAENEQIKNSARNIVKDASLSTNERYEAQIKIFKCLFSRSLSANNFNENYISFDTYISMLLNQKKVKDILGTDLYNRFVKEYGTSPGIPEGQTYYFPQNKPITIAAHFDGDEYTEEELDKIKEFAAFVKSNRK